MAGNVTGLHVFAADVGPEALSLLDGNYSPLVTALNTLANFSNYYVDSGAVNALVVTTVGAQAFSYVDGVLLEVQVGNTTTSTTPTLNVNGLGGKTITDNSGNALQLGALIVGSRYLFIYDGVNFRCLNPSAFAQRGVPFVRFKPASTARSNTITMTNDPDLQVALVAGTYRFELLVGVFLTSSTTQGVSYNVNYSGTFSTNFLLVMAQQSAPTAQYFTSLSVQTAPGNGAFNPTIPTASGGPGWFQKIDGMFTATASGILAFAWAQTSSNANATNVSIGSLLVVTPMS
jgi:hypothetical protein